MPQSFIPAFTESDLAAIRRLIAEDRSRRRTTQGRQEHVNWDEAYPGPETYIARTQPEGIPGMVEEAGTGVNDVPGYSDCDIYRVIWTSPGIPSGIPELQPITGLFKRVYNSSHTPIAGGTWVLVTRDKFGEWWVVESRGSFQILLTDKTYTPGQFIAYSWIRVLDTAATPIVYTEQDMSGGPGRNPAYHERNLDLPVVQHGADAGTGTGTFGQVVLAAHELSVVRARRGYGPIPGTSSVTTPAQRYLLFGEEPWVDLFRRTGIVDEYGEIGYHRYLDQDDDTWKDGKEVRIVEAE
jgi:hypothetical protein